MLDGMSDCIQGSRIENLHSREVDCQSSTGLILFEIFDFKNAVTLKIGLVIRQGHWKCHHSIERIWLPIDVL